ncbi:MAG: hypothetical protein ABIY55_01305 [Kofleriaceae bacterium]
MPQELVAQHPDLHDHARMRTSLFIILALAACGDDGGKATPDAKPAIDAAVAIDGAPAPTLDCPTYCTEIQTNCTAANGQYQDMAHCLGTCKAFAVGTLADRTGDTLGCRLYHGGAPAAADAAGATLHCPHAGPGGDKISATAPAFCSGGNVCEDFCNIHVKTCGTIAAPLTGITPQYQDMAACMTTCGAFPNKTTDYANNASKGDTLACRLYHVTNAAAQTDPAMISAHCLHSGPNGGTAQATCMTGTAP